VELRQLGRADTSITPGAQQIADCVCCIERQRRRQLFNERADLHDPKTSWPTLWSGSCRLHGVTTLQ
jgi:hypothetical protein